MGYYTEYALEITDGSKAITEPCESCKGTGTVKVDLITKLCDQYDDLDYVIRGGEASKWYDHEVDMKKISEQYPNLVFRLSGEGEEAGDVWVKYFKGGKMQVERAEIKLPGFDPSKLS